MNVHDVNSRRPAHYSLAEATDARNRLVLEITERVLLQETDDTVAVFNQLHDLGAFEPFRRRGAGQGRVTAEQRFVS